MKPPITLEELMREWEKDAKWDETETGSEILKLTNLRSKYLTIRSHHNIVVSKLEHKYTKFRHIYGEYLAGNLNNKEDLENYGFEEPCMQPLKKYEINKVLDADDKLNNLLIQRVTNQEIVDSCDEIIKALHARSFLIKEFINWKRYLRGEDF